MRVNFFRYCLSRTDYGSVSFSPAAVAFWYDRAIFRMGFRPFPMCLVITVGTHQRPSPVKSRTRKLEINIDVYGVNQALAAHSGL
jgi:hypothetical protein